MGATTLLLAAGISTKKHHALNANGAIFAHRTVEAGYPFLNGHRLAEHQRGDNSNSTVILVASGSGIFVVDVDTNPAIPSLAPGIENNRIMLDPSNGGMVHSIAPAGILGPRTDAFFVAAGHAGLFRLNSSDYEVTHATDFGDVHVVALCPGGVLVAGTHSNAGRPAGLFAFNAANLTPLWNITAPNDVWSIACPRSSSSSSRKNDNNFPLVAGGWCWGLHLFSANVHRAVAVSTWSDGEPLLVRDALLDNGTLVVAANTRGLLGFSVTGTAIKPLWQKTTGGLATGLTPISLPGEVVAISTP